jgi:hypothetical protein
MFELKYRILQEKKIYSLPRFGTLLAIREASEAAKVPPTL